MMDEVTASLDLLGDAHTRIYMCTRNDAAYVHVVRYDNRQVPETHDVYEFTDYGSS